MKTLPGEQIFQSKFNFTSKDPFCIQDGIKKDVFFKVRHFLKVTKLLNLKISFLTRGTCAA